MAMKTRRAVLYLRVSTGEQTTENQRMALRSEAERRGWQLVGEYEDAGISGTKGRDKRPGLDSLLKDARRGRFDIVMCWALDRLGRSLRHLIDTAQELESAAVDLYVAKQSIDTTSPAGRLFFHLVGSFAEYERDMIRDRVVAGLARAKAKGTRLGRPRIGADAEVRIRSLLESGMGVQRAAKAAGVGAGTVQRIKAEIASKRAEAAPESA